MLSADVLKEFAAKKCMKLGRLIKERGPEWRLPKPNPTRNSKTEKCSYVRVGKKTPQKQIYCELIKLKALFLRI